MISVGTIFRDRDDPESNPPKEKWYIVVGINAAADEFATVYINSDINTGALNSEELIALQKSIEPCPELGFLTYTSYIDCSRLKYRLHSETMRGINEGRISVLGKLPKDDLREVLEWISSAESIPPYYIDKYRITRP